MRGLFLWALLAASPAASTVAQDLASDALSSAGSHAGTVGVNSHLKGKPRRGSPRAAGPLNARSRAMCAEKAAYRNRFGADDPRVVKLFDLCGRGGM